jgi:hypothetical protein
MSGVKVIIPVTVHFVHVAGVVQDVKATGERSHGLDEFADDLVDVHLKGEIEARDIMFSSGGRLINQHSSLSASGIEEGGEIWATASRGRMGDICKLSAKALAAAAAPSDAAEAPSQKDEEETPPQYKPNKRAKGNDGAPHKRKSRRDKICSSYSKKRNRHRAAAANAASVAAAAAAAAAAGGAS